MSERRKRVLLLDNDESILIELERRLEDEGIETTTSWDAHESLGLLGTRHYDLLVMGDHPPEVTAGEILRELQYLPVKVPCLVLQTASRYPFEPDYLCSLGARDVLPTRDQDRIVNSVRSCLETRGPSSPRPARGAAA